MVKAAVFFVLCALLVWALGGQLFPAPEVADGEPVQFNGHAWFWRMSVGGREPGTMHWSLMKTIEGEAVPFDDQRWSDVAGPVVVDDALYFAGRSEHPAESKWWLHRLVMTSNESNMTTCMYPDRLAVEQQLQRLRQGLPLQDVETVRSQRPAVLDPAGVSADEQPIAGGQD